MIVEAIKIIYPDIHSFIESYPQYLLVHPVKYDGTPDQDKKSDIEKHIEQSLSRYDSNQKQNVLELLRKLFPQLETVYRNTAYPDRSYAEWNRNQRICSPQYFNRYFSYCVIKGELSDLSFDKFISDLSLLKEDEIQTSLNKLMEDSTWDNLIQKLRLIEKELTWDKYQKIALALAKNINGINYNKRQYFFQSFSPIGQLVYFISRGLDKDQVSVEDKLDFTKKLLSETDSIDFAYDILRDLNPQQEDNQKSFDKEQFTILWETLNNRVLECAASNDKDIFDQFPHEAYFICKFWENYDPNSFNRYIKKVVDQNSNIIIKVLRTYLPRFRTVGEDNQRDGNLEEKTYKYLISILDKDYIAENLHTIFSNEEIQSSPVHWNEREEYVLSDIDLTRQFFHWYNLSKEELPT